MTTNEHDPAIVRAAQVLIDLRDAMAEIQIAHPAYSPGTGPTAADNCKQILDMMDWSVRQIATYLGLSL